MSQIPDFDAKERRIVEAACLFRYGKVPTLEAADVELQLDPAREDLTACPSLTWRDERGVEFVVCKVAAGRYRSHFVEPGDEQFGTGRDYWDSLEECMHTLLRLHADHEAQRAEMRARVNAAIDGDDDYHGPLMI